MLVLVDWLVELEVDDVEMDVDVVLADVELEVEVVVTARRTPSMTEVGTVGVPDGEDSTATLSVAAKLASAVTLPDVLVSDIVTARLVPAPA